MKFLQTLRHWKKQLSHNQPLVTITVDKERLLHNLRLFQHYQAVAPVLKSNAYGHGLVQVAKILDDQQLPFLVVDSLFEARTLRAEGIKAKILVIGFTTVENINKVRLQNVSFTITSYEQLEDLAKNLKRKTAIHLKLDTGMHRQGIMLNDLNHAISLLQQNKNIIVEGICSHLADADSEEETFSMEQIRLWNEAVKELKAVFPTIKYTHLSATAGSFYSKEIDANVMRLGIGLYGINTSLKTNLDLQPVLEMKTVVSGVRTIQAGEGIGYNLTFKADKQMKIATIPVGYFEGVDRRLSNKGFFMIKGKPCPIVGRVSMNISTADVSDLPDVKMNDDVLVISKERSDLNSVEEIARLCETVPYEILVHIPQHLRRTVF
ncbi:MAG: alanine racemase [bacterium]